MKLKSVISFIFDLSLVLNFLGAIFLFVLLSSLFLIVTGGTAATNFFIPLGVFTFPCTVLCFWTNRKQRSDTFYKVVLTLCIAFYGLAIWQTWGSLVYYKCHEHPNFSWIDQKHCNWNTP